MRSSFPVLLAVSFNVVAAGLLRRAPFDRCVVVHSGYQHPLMRLRE